MDGTLSASLLCAQWKAASRGCRRTLRKEWGFSVSLEVPLSLLWFSALRPGAGGVCGGARCCPAQPWARSPQPLSGCTAQPDGCFAAVSLACSVLEPEAAPGPSPGAWSPALVCGFPSGWFPTVPSRGPWPSLRRTDKNFRPGFTGPPLQQEGVKTGSLACSLRWVVSLFLSRGEGRGRPRGQATRVA